MKDNHWYPVMVTLALALLMGAVLWATLARAAPTTSPHIQGGAPSVISYQGEVYVSGAPYSGTGYFKFAVIDVAGHTTYWSNDGTSSDGAEPTDAVPLPVANGLFNVLLGNSGMQPLAAAVFDAPNRALRVWFSVDGSTFAHLTPDTRIAAVPYALQAAQAQAAASVSWSGIQGAPDTYPPAAHQHPGSDITSAVPTATLALSATQALSAAQAPWSGIQGAPAAYPPTAHQHPGNDITSTVPTATLALSAAQAPWSGLTGVPGGFADGIDHTGGHYAQVIVVAKSGGDFEHVQAALDSITDATAEHPYLVWVAPGVYSETVTLKPHVHLQGAGQAASLITSTVSHTDTMHPARATLVLTRHTSLRALTVGNAGSGAVNVSILAGKGTTDTLIFDVTARTQGPGTHNYALHLAGDFTVAHGDTEIGLQAVTALAKNGGSNYGLGMPMGASVTLRGGQLIARGGSATYGIYSNDTSTLWAYDVNVLAENGSSNYGLYESQSTSRLYGSVLTARGGSHTRAVWSGSGDLSVGEIIARDVTLLAENGSEDNYGLHNEWLAEATLYGGDVTARGGDLAYGLYNEGESTLETYGVTVLAQTGTISTCGLYNTGGMATTTGGSFTARGGGTSYGIYNTVWATLEASNITAMGQEAGANYGLYHTGSGTTSKINHAQLIGTSDGLYQDGGNVYLGSTQLDGDAIRASGTLTCYAVYDGNYAAYTCP